jgi:elongation factor P--(R)-beta-lysine ligase
VIDDWQPACNLELLHQRAKLLQAVRVFFIERGVLEVETPLLSQSGGTDPQLDFFTTEFTIAPRKETFYLQTSPEFAMKRLLAAGSGSIFQICKAFRNSETGRFHNPEFTMLEWYRVGYNLIDLMDEIADLIAYLYRDQPLLNSAQRFSYQSVFDSYTGLNPLVFDYAGFCAAAIEHNLPDAISICGHDHALWLDFLFSHSVQPHLGENALCLVYGYPACQSSLARINTDNSNITDRVEIFINGVELGNGYFELTDAFEQEKRFDKEIQLRQSRGQAEVLKDQRLISAMKSGLPDCSGMAIGLDRLLMVLSGSSHINEVLAFPVGRV